MEFLTLFLECLEFFSTVNVVVEIDLSFLDACNMMSNFTVKGTLIPSGFPKAHQDLYEIYYNSNKSNLTLYVRTVFISDEIDELLPKYLSFLKVIKVC